MKKLFAFAAVAMAMLFAGNKADAQFSLEFGYNFKSLHQEVTLLGTTTKSDTAYSGLYVGANFGVNITERFSITPGAFLGLNATSDKVAGVKYTTSMADLIVPVTFDYAFNLSDDIRLKLFLGPQFEFGLGWVTTNDQNDNKLNWYDKNDVAFELSRLNIGGTVGFRVDFQKVYIRAGFSVGFMDLVKDDNFAMHTGRLLLGAGFVF